LPTCSRCRAAPADLNLSPQRRREKLFAALLRQLEAHARRQPVLMVLEDLHWIDPSSRELLDLTVERVTAGGLPVLLILTFRPEFQAPWSGLRQVTALILSRLDPQTGAAMVERIAGNRKLPEALAAEIVERADGVPLFVEELTRAVIDAGPGGVALAGAASLPSSGVPPALHISLTARLDRLGPGAREIAQIGAVIGRDFAYELLAPIAARSDAELADGLSRLTDAGLVFQRRAAPTATYLFKHALVRDAAYSTLLRSRRQQLHTAVAAALETDFPDTVGAQPELLAHHFTEAGIFDQAVGYWQRAGERAVARSALLEAIAHLNRGIAVLETLPESAMRDERELALQVALIGSLSASRGRGSSEVELPATRALELSRRIGAETPAQFWAMLWLGLFYLVRGALPLARELAKELLGVAGRRQEAELLAYGHWDLGLTLLWSGAWPDARVHLEQAIALYDPEWGRPATFRAGMNCLALSYDKLGRVL
jgi:predicted ATPase